MNEIEELKNRVEALETELSSAVAIMEQQNRILQKQQVVNTKFSEKIVQIFEILKMAFPSTFH